MANNIIVPVPTELKDIKSELMFGLTKRQLIGFGLTIVTVVPTFIFIKKISLTASMYISFFVGMPFIFFTMYIRDKLHIEKWFKNWLEANILFKEKRLFKVTEINKEVAIARGFIENGSKEKPISKNTASNRSQEK